MFGLIAMGVMAAASAGSAAYSANKADKQTDPNRPNRRRLGQFISILEDYQIKERERFSRGQALLTSLANANLNVGRLYA